MATPRLTRFTLRGADGGPLRGEVRHAGRTRRPAVVICHGFKGFKDWGCFPHLADRVARAGFTAVSFNFSGSGVGEDGQTFDEPERFGHATFGKDLDDLASVVAALGAGDLVPDLPPPTAVGLVGHSRGGGVALLHAAAHGGVDALVTWSAIGTVHRWGPETVRLWRAAGSLPVTNQRTGDVLPLYLDVLDEIERHPTGRLDVPGAASRITCPWLLLHGEVDETIPVREAEELVARSDGRATLLVVPQGSHTFGARHPWAGMTPALERAFDATVAWFSDALLPRDSR